MKRLYPIAAVTILAAALLAAFTLCSGCAANDPTVMADTAAIKTLQAQIASTTQPAELPALQAKLSALETKESSDMAAAQAKIGDQATKVAGISGTVGTIASSTGTPWGQIIGAIGFIVSAGATAYGANQKNKADAAKAVIAAADEHCSGCPGGH